MKVKVQRTVHHAPERVFDVLSDLGWNGSTQHVAGQGLGARYRSTSRVGPHEVVTDWVVTAWEPPRRLAWRTEHDALAHEAEVRILPHRQGSRIVQVDRETWHHAPWWARLAGRFAVRRELARRLAVLEQALDGAQPGDKG